MADEPKKPEDQPVIPTVDHVNVRLGEDDTDPVPPEMRKLMAWLQANRNALLIGAAAVLATFVVSNTLHSSREAKANTVSKLLSSAQKPEDIQSVLDGYPDAPGVANGRLSLARYQYREGAYDKALEHYDVFVAKHADHGFILNARLERLHALEALGKNEDALAGFIEFAEKNPEHYLHSDAVLGRARCLQNLGKLAEAKQVLENLLASNASETWKAIAREKTGLIERKLKVAAK